MKGRKTGGRKKGTPNKLTSAHREEVASLARRLIEDPAYLESLRTRLHEGRAGHLEVTLWHYAHGKPPETLLGPGPGGEHLIAYGWEP